MIAAACIGFAVLVLALVGRDVVIRILAHERERLRSHDGDAVERRLTKLEADARATATRFEKLEMGRLGR